MRSVKKTIILITLILMTLAGCGEKQQESISGEIQPKSISGDIQPKSISDEIQQESFSLITEPTCLKGPNDLPDPVANHYPDRPEMNCHINRAAFEEFANINAAGSGYFVLVDIANEEIISLINDEKMNRLPIPSAPSLITSFHDVFPTSLTKISKPSENITCLFINSAGAKNLYCNTGQDATGNVITDDLKRELSRFLPNDSPIKNIDFILYLNNATKEVSHLRSGNYVKTNLNSINPTDPDNKAQQQKLSAHFMIGLLHSFTFVNPSCHYENINGKETLVCSKV